MRVPLKSNMDRFIVKTYEFQYTSDNTLKSNMDRFIVKTYEFQYTSDNTLKSNMDRFIVCINSFIVFLIFL